MFVLHPQLKRDTYLLGELRLCSLLLMNNHYFPWLILVPRGNDLIEISDLPMQSRIDLMEETAEVSSHWKEIIGADKMNIAMLGNVVSQLHMHIIARKKNDIAWPSTVWGRDNMPYETLPESAKLLQQRLGILLSA